MRLLIVEDEPLIQQQLNDSLKQAGFTTDSAADGEEGLYFATEYSYDLAIIDLGLPKLDGVQLIEKIRAEDIRTPILILTARGGWQDKVEGLDAGGDDYLVKPFHPEELLARVNALIRRSAGLAKSTLEAGPILLNLSTQQVKLAGKTLDLTAFEYKVLEYLMLHPEQVVSKTELTEHIYDQDYDRDSNVIEVFVGRLRKKLDPESRYKPIETLRGRGYRFNNNLAQTE